MRNKKTFKPGDKFILELGEERKMFGEFEIAGTDLYVKTDLLRDAIDAVLKLTYADGAYGYADAKDLVDSLENLPPAQPETTRILAEALNGSPLLYPCDKLWSREGWCKDHCKKGQTEPDTECWLKYAETIAAERREDG